MKISPSKIRARLQTRDISRALRCVWIFFLRVLKVGEFVLDFPSLFFVCACDVEKKDILLVCFGVDLKKQTNTQKNNRRERENVRRARERETNSRDRQRTKTHTKTHTKT